MVEVAEAASATSEEMRARRPGIVGGRRADPGPVHSRGLGHRRLHHPQEFGAAGGRGAPGRRHHAQRNHITG